MQSLLNKKRFEVWEKEKAHWLRNLSLKQALRLEESLLSSDFTWILRKNFIPDNPICLKDGLRRKT